MLSAGRRGDRRGARRRADGEVVACGLDHQGESVLAWDAESGRPLTPIVTWQDKRSQEVLDRLEADGRADEVRERSGMPLDPYFSAGKLSLAARARRGGRQGARRRHPAAGHRRLVPLRPARRRVRHRSLDRLADPARRSRVGPGAARDLRRARARRCRAIADTAGDLGMLRHDSGRVELPLRARCVDQQAALAGAGCVEPGLAKATYGTGVFVLAHAGDERPAPERRPAADGRLADRRPGRVGARRRRVHRRGAAGVAQPRPRPRRRPGGARRGRAARSRTRAGCGCCPRWPGSAPRGGVRTRAR